MNFIEKLSALMKKEDLNTNTLAKKSGVPYTTIDALFKKGYEGVRMSTVKKLAAYFNVSLDYLMDDNVDDPNYGKTDIEKIADSLESVAKSLNRRLGNTPYSDEQLKSLVKNVYFEQLFSADSSGDCSKEDYSAIAEIAADIVVENRKRLKQIEEENEYQYNIEREEALLSNFRQLNDVGKSFAIDFLETMSTMEKYQNEK